MVILGLKFTDGEVTRPDLDRLDGSARPAVDISLTKKGIGDQTSLFVPIYNVKREKLI